MTPRPDNCSRMCMEFYDTKLHAKRRIQSRTKDKGWREIPRSREHSSSASSPAAFVQSARNALNEKMQKATNQQRNYAQKIVQVRKQWKKCQEKEKDIYIYRERTRDRLAEDGVWLGSPVWDWAIYIAWQVGQPFRTHQSMQWIVWRFKWNYIKWLKWVATLK